MYILPNKQYNIILNIALFPIAFDPKIPITPNLSSKLILLTWSFPYIKMFWNSNVFIYQVFESTISELDSNPLCKCINWSLISFGTWDNCVEMYLSK